MNPVNFTANYVDSAYIKYRNKNNIKTDKQVAVVELDKNSEADREAIYSAACMWKNGKDSNYAWNILSAMERSQYPWVEEEHYIAITTQKNNYDELDGKKILGVMMFSDHYEDKYEIDWLQVKPRCNYSDSKNDRRYSQVGSAMIKYLKDNYKLKPIYVSPAVEAVEFYKKRGFNQEGESEYNLCYFE